MSHDQATALAPAPASDAPAAGRRAGPWHRRVEGLHVLKVQGSFYEMGRQHGELLREWVGQGPLPYYRTYLERLVRTARMGPLADLVWPVLRRMVGRRVAAGLTDYAHETLRGLSDGSGLRWQDVLDACTMPDALLWAASRVMKLRRIGPAMHHRLQLGLGCTSAIAWGDATRDGRLLHARNFDYHGVASWTRTAAVVFHEPARGQRYVSVAAAGIPLGGATAMNEAGLTLTVHQHMFTDRAALGGTPVGLVGDEVMREASSLDEAEAILSRQRPIGCWTYLVTDGRRREVLCWEEDPGLRARRRLGGEGGTFGYTNIYLDPALGKTERALYGSYWRHNAGRYRRAHEALQARRGEHDPATMAGVLADPGDPGCRISESIAMLMTVGSVVFRPEDGAFWVATGEAPTSHGTFVPFDLGREDHAPEHGALRCGPGAEAPAREAFEHYRRAYLAYFDDEDLAAARARLAEAVRLQPEQPLYRFVAGVLALKAGEHAPARSELDRAVALGHAHRERTAAFHLWRGRALDLAGERPQALADYRAALELPADEPVHRAANRGLRRRFSARSAARLHLDFAFADVMAP